MIYKPRVPSYLGKQLENGDWEITSSDGSKWVTSDADFQRSYEPMDTPSVKSRGVVSNLRQFVRNWGYRK